MRRCARPTAGRTRSACGRASSFRRRSGQPARGPCHRRARSRRGRRRESPRSPSRARASRARSSRGYRSRAVSSISVDLSGKAALVTGAASGIGRAIAEDLASRGARVLLADIDEPALRSVAARHGLMGLTKTVALEAADKGVTVNAVCPSYVRTPLVEKQIADQARVNKMSEEEVIEKIMLAPAAIKRLLEPSEVAAYVAFL